MKYLLLFILAACSNDAITYAKAIDKRADCKSLQISWSGTKPDTAVCRVGNEIWSCRVDTYNSDCKLVRKISAEGTNFLAGSD